MSIFIYVVSNFSNQSNLNFLDFLALLKLDVVSPLSISVSVGIEYVALVLLLSGLLLIRL